MNITIIFDNYSYKEDFKTGWGFSCLIKSMEKTILFDTGADGEILLSNMEKAKINPKIIDTIFLSHEHGDHIGGISRFLEINSAVEVFLPKSFSPKTKQKIETSSAKYTEVEKLTEVCKDVYSTGELGTWLKEQSLVLKSKEGLVIITGCAHPGINDIVRFAKEHFGEKVFLILGGFHLGGYFGRELDEIIWNLKDLGVLKSAPCHCTGDEAQKTFEREYGKNFIKLGVGRTIEVE